MLPTNFVLCTLGTRGDILPFVALGCELRRRGHAITVLANQNWQSLITSNGLAFEAIAPQDPTQSGRDDYLFFVENTLPSFTKSFNIVKRRVEEAGRHIILVYRSNMLGMECAADVFGLPHFKVALQPCAIRSFERPPWPLTPLAIGRFRTLFKRVIIPAMYGIAEITRRYRGPANRFRRSVGIHVPWGRVPTKIVENATILFAPTWYAMPQKDWPENCHCVGFPFLDDDGGDADVAAFVALHGAPIVFTKGTGVVDTTAFFTKAEAICRLLNMPAIFLGSDNNTKPDAPNILVKGFIDMAWLLSHARLIVHHGGVGTTAQALRAGVPQIILPDRFDQPDNAQRIARLGLGAAVMKDTFSPTEWSGLIQQLLNTPLMRQRLNKVAADIRRSSAVSSAADVIEETLNVATPQVAQRKQA